MDDLDRIIGTARQEVLAEKFRRAVEEEKERIRTTPPAPWWHRFIPFQISITRRK